MCVLGGGGGGGGGNNNETRVGIVNFSSVPINPGEKNGLYTGIPIMANVTV